MALFFFLIMMIALAIGAVIYGFTNSNQHTKKSPEEPIDEDTGEFTQEELDDWYINAHDED